MSRYIIKIRDKYLEWSDITAAPTTPALTMEQMREYLKESYGEGCLHNLSSRWERVEKHGTSLGVSVTDLIADNRAGINGVTLSVDEIYEHYR